MHNFTYAELSGFTYGQLHKTPKELVEQIQTYGSEIPYNTYTKLLKICDDINGELDKHSVKPLEPPKNEPQSIRKFINALLYLVVNYKSLKESVESFLDTITDLFF